MDPDGYEAKFYIGQHETRRALPVSDGVLRRAQDYGYDMLTTPITTPYFHSRVLALLSSHLSQFTSDALHSPQLPPPRIPPLMPVDTPLMPSESISQFLGVTSPWIDLCSVDPLIAELSRQVLALEVGYAAFCGLGNVIVRASTGGADGLAQFARAIQEALGLGPYLSVSIWMSMAGEARSEGGNESEQIGDLSPFARPEYMEQAKAGKSRGGLEEAWSMWDAWHIVRSSIIFISVLARFQSVTSLTPKLNVALDLPRHMPPAPIQDRWFSEPLRFISLPSKSFLLNKNGYPVLSKTHQALITCYMRLRTAPWLILSDVGIISDGAEETESFVTATATAAADRQLSPSATIDAARSPPASTETNPLPGHQAPKARTSSDPTPHLSYLRHLQRTQPARTTLERFGSGYQDYLQAPLQPLTDNLESMTYEVFEKDPVKYDWYERAIAAALRDWTASGKAASGPDSRVVIAVVGAGRGPLVTRALNASAATGVPINMWAVEKNPNAYVLLQRHNETSWDGRVHVVHSDMRAWAGPGILSSGRSEARQKGAAQTGGKVDILVSELLGSFADNELSPECLDGAQHVLHGGSISIPTAYTAHLTPIGAPKLHADISTRAAADPTATETPYVVMLHAISYLASEPAIRSTEVFMTDIKTAWEFRHPLPPSSDPCSLGIVARDGQDNTHNTRFARLKFACPFRGVCHGLAGYFEAELWGQVELSTRPDRMAEKSKDMISWFPIFFPLKNPLYFPDDTELLVSIWRQTDGRKVWYEWMVEAFAHLGPGRKITRLGASELCSSRKNGCMM
ncbi:MAG: hypothetical protein M1825_000363 [Sarcosagium campestre]|nr:MAG: hypothetical protein M1825_000363 [Sarcosagium campestre]